MPYTPQSNADLWTRYRFKDTKGDKHEQRVSTVAYSVFAAARDAQALIGAGASGVGTETTQLLADLDTFMLHLHTASNALAH